MGFDLNRHWQEPSPWAHPTLYATKNLLLEYDRDDVSLLLCFLFCFLNLILVASFVETSSPIGLSLTWDPACQQLRAGNAKINIAMWPSFKLIQFSMSYLSASFIKIG